MGKLFFSAGLRRPGRDEVGNIDTERQKPANWRTIQFFQFKDIRFSSVNGQIRSQLN
jgi:hypothetical protein